LNDSSRTVIQMNFEHKSLTYSAGMLDVAWTLVLSTFMADSWNVNICTVISSEAIHQIRMCWQLLGGTKVEE